MSGRQQFNITLPPTLVRKIKYGAIDAQLSASHFVEQLLTNGINRREQVMTGLTLQPMLHVEDMPRSVAFFEALGAEVQHGSRDGDFCLLRIGTTSLSLLAHPPNPEQDEGKVELNFDSDRDLHEVERGLRSAGIDIAQSTTDEGFGSQLQLRLPDGLLVKINHLEQELYT